MPRETKAQTAKRLADEAVTGGRETADAEVPEAPPQPNGVFVSRSFDPDGKVTVEVSHLGDARVTEVPTILELGLARFREVALGQKPG